MTIEEKVEAILKGSVAFTTLVPVGQIKLPGNWQQMDLPYVVHFPVVPTPTRTYSGLAALTEWEYQVSVFGSPYSQARAVVDVLRSLFGDTNVDGVRFLWRGPQTPMIEPATRLVHIPVLFQIFEAL